MRAGGNKGLDTVLFEKRIRQRFHQNDIIRLRSAQVSPMRSIEQRTPFTLQGSQVRNLHFPPRIRFKSKACEIYSQAFFVWYEKSMKNILGRSWTGLDNESGARRHTAARQLFSGLSHRAYRIVRRDHAEAARPDEWGGADNSRVTRPGGASDWGTV